MLNLFKVPKGADATTPEDFEEVAAPPLPEPVGTGARAEVSDVGTIRPATGPP